MRSCRRLYFGSEELGPPLLQKRRVGPHLPYVGVGWVEGSGDYGGEGGEVGEGGVSGVVRVSWL